MIISMRRHATHEEIDSVIQRIEEFGYKIPIEGEERVVSLAKVAEKSDDGEAEPEPDLGIS